MIRRGAVIALVTGCLAAGASATTMPSLTVGVSVALKTKSITLSSKAVRRGYYVEFHVRNTTGHRRTFSLAGKSIVVPARKLRLMAVEFDRRGRYAYASRGPHSAVRGVFRVS